MPETALLMCSLVSILEVVVYHLCSLGSLDKDRLVDLLVVGISAGKVNKVFSFDHTARQHILFISGVQLSSAFCIPT